VQLGEVYLPFLEWMTPDCQLPQIYERDDMRYGGQAFDFDERGAARMAVLYLQPPG